MSKHWITEAAHEALKNHVLIGRELTESPRVRGGRMVELDEDVMEELGKRQAEGESLSDVIIAVCTAPSARRQ